VSFSPKGWLAVGGNDHTVTIWNPDCGQKLFTLRDHEGPVCAVAFSPDGRLASAGQDGLVRVWDAELANELFTITGHSGAVRSVAFSQDGRQLASGGDDEMIKVCDAATGVLLFDLQEHTGIIHGLAYSSCGRLASVGASKTIRIWDSSTGQQLVALGRREAATQCVAFSPNGQLMAAGTPEGGLIVLDGRPLTNDDINQRQALALLESLCSQEFSLAQILDRIREDRSIREPVGQQAENLAPTYRQGFVRREADRQIRALAEHFLPPEEVAQRISVNHALPEDIRQEALAQAEDYIAYPEDLVNTSRYTLRRSDMGAADRRLAVRRAQAACRLCPDNGSYVLTLGMAHYRQMEYRQALERLQQARRLDESAGNSAAPALLAFLAMTQYHLGKHQEALRILEQLRDMMHHSPWSTQDEALAFLQEAEALIAGATAPAPK
jgi:hypothetical protein